MEMQPALAHQFLDLLRRVNVAAPRAAYLQAASGMADDDLALAAMSAFHQDYPILKVGGQPR